MNVSSPLAQPAASRTPAYYARLALLWTVAGCLFKLWFCTTFELTGDEAYYWLWSRRLDWCYYSKGPLVAWAIALGRALLGDTEMGVRLPAVLFGSGTVWLLFLLGRRLFSARIGFWAGIVAGLTPLFVVGSVLMTIDVLSVFFWTAAACAFWRAKDSPRLGPWLGAGLLIGLGMLAKYTNVALIPSFAAFCLMEKSCRRLPLRLGFWAMIAAALFCLLPPLIWNSRHDWITLRHLLQRGSLDRAWQFSTADLGQFFGLQAVVSFPLFFAGLIASLFSADLRRTFRAAYVYLLCLFLPLFLFYAVLASHAAGPPNWTAPCYVAGLLLMTAAWTRWSDLRPAARRAAAAAIATAAILTVAFLASTGLRLPGKRDPLLRVRGARSLAQQVLSFQEKSGASLIIGQHYQVASLLAFYLPGHPDVFAPRNEEARSQFAFWPGYAETYRGKDAVFVAKNDNVPDALRHEFREIEPAMKIDTVRRGRPVREFYLFACRGLLPEPEGSRP